MTDRYDSRRDRKSKNHEKCKSPRDIVLNESHGAMMLKVTTNSIANPRIHFDQGLGNENCIQVNQRGTWLTFKSKGLYRIIIQGKINLGSPDGYFRIRRNPEFDQDQESFSTFKIRSGRIYQSTILPVRKGNKISFCISGTNSGPVVIGAGMQVEIYKVGNF